MKNYPLSYHPITIFTTTTTIARQQIAQLFHATNSDHNTFSDYPKGWQIVSDHNRIEQAQIILSSLPCHKNLLPICIRLKQHEIHGAITYAKEHQLVTYKLPFIANSKNNSFKPKITLKLLSQTYAKLKPNESIHLFYEYPPTESCKTNYIQFSLQQQQFIQIESYINAL